MSEPWDPSRPIPDDDPSRLPQLPASQPSARSSMESREIAGGAPRQPTSLETISGAAEPGPPSTGAPTQVKLTGPARSNVGPLDGKVIGKFRNTYYDFPSEADYSGPQVPLYDSQCKAKVAVARSFFETLCVQGSGLLKSGNAVSFNRRDCECAPECPRTGQKICFDVLELNKFPWGRGATGQPITPLLTVAVDTSVIPLGTPIYIPEFVGLPRDVNGEGKHDGCFIAQDRGLRVKGEHVDVFTGQAAMTRLWNGLVPSNTGVTVVVKSPRCDRAE